MINEKVFSKKHTLLTLIGFPIVSTLISLLLLNREVFYSMGLDFFSVFWVIIICWYIIQIFLVKRMLKSSNMSLSAVGYNFDKRKTLYFISAYLIFAFALFGLIEFALSSAELTPEKLSLLSDFSDITPKTTGQRIIFIFAGLVAGISEEIVYRGFAINSLEGHGVNKWLAILLAAIPFVFQHGLKSIDQFWWFFTTGLVMGGIYVLVKRKLYINIIIHWLVILFGMLAILQVLD